VLFRSLREVELSPAFEALHDAHATLLRYEAARAMAWEVRNHSDRLSEAFALRMREGLAIPQDRYLHALTAARQGRQRIASESTGCDVLLTLSARGEAPLGLDDTGDATFNRVWTLLHVPCIHLPSGSSTAGLPLGFQVVGRVDDDPATLESARWIQSVLPFTRQLPLS
jgi:Asp-tRNA(Asn)/Glu-tRNA(Gln) amidotransferase A subunit family amidase